MHNGDDMKTFSILAIVFLMVFLTSCAEPPRLLVTLHISCRYVETYTALTTAVVTLVCTYTLVKAYGTSINKQIAALIRSIAQGSVWNRNTYWDVEANWLGSHEAGVVHSMV